MVVKARSKQDTKEFYSQLMQGEVQRGVLGTDKRFNANAIAGKDSVRKYFTNVVAPYLGPEDRVLDLGCGTGGFTLALASLCKQVVAVDIVEDFVHATEKLIDEHKLENVEILYQESERIPADDQSFDAVVLVDTIHHLEDIDETIREAMRVLKPGGRLVVFEPNKLNPLIYLMHFVDRNEWGLLRLGRPGIYRRRLAKHIEIDNVDFSGLVVGPDSGIFPKIADILNHPRVYPWAGWLLPKIFITGTRHA